MALTWRAVRGWKRPPSARRLLEELHLLDRVPVDVVHVAQQLGVKAYGTPLQYGGLLKIDGDDATIWVPNSESTGKQRYAIAHMLGHLLLHPLLPERKESTFCGSREETEANRFAKALILPFELFDVYAMAGKGEEALARIFCVTPLAARVRLVEWAGDLRVFDGNY